MMRSVEGASFRAISARSCPRSAAVTPHPDRDPGDAISCRPVAVDELNNDRDHRQHEQ